jgi:radical SAM superfamily enzyme YgiQ (UPF0313 family)
MTPANDAGPPSRSRILLVTLNARYIHSSLGLRYLLANLGSLQTEARILEFTIQDRLTDLAERLLAERPEIVGFGVYIWNLIQTTELVALLKRLRPEIRIVLGGPEVSHEYRELPIVAAADYLITGPADLAFADLCRRLLGGERPCSKVVEAVPPAPAQIALPYDFYDDRDLAYRVLYVEASRGCPFRCEFCLSALDPRVLPFDRERFLAALQALYRRGARRFKFVDRTFNLRIDDCLAILEFFLARLEPGLFLHFELIPDRLPRRLKAAIARFPPGSLQFEVGVQSFNPEVQARIGRRQDNAKSADNLRWLSRESGAHVHADLIVGLPGEDLVSFGTGLDRLVALGPQEVQIGLLKRLRGAPIARHTDPQGMVYQPFPPYQVLQTGALSFQELQRMGRFARYWDLVINSGRFRACRPLLLGSQPFARFLAFSDWLYARTGQTHRIRLERLLALVYLGLTECLGSAETVAGDAVWEDFCRSGLKGTPPALRALAAGRQRKPLGAKGRLPARQARHAGG